MNGFQKKVEQIIISVKTESPKGLTTDIVPTLKDMLSARIIIKNFKSYILFSQKFPNTTRWLCDLEKQKNWESILQDLLYLVKNTNTKNRLN